MGDCPVLNRLRHVLIGPPLPTQQLAHERLNKIRALASFSPDALSSIAYANQEIYLGLVVAGSAALTMAWPIALTITALLLLVALSYYQTMAGYPSGGGSYAVARENLGALPGLVAAAALSMGYLLTAAVSLTAGTEALASAFPTLWPHRVAISLVLLAAISLLNLRGLRETGTLMAIPVYLFLIVFLSLVVYGFLRLGVDGPGSLAAVAPPAREPLTMLLLLRTFSAGCTALTGIEAISNGVPAFRPPEARNAQKTLAVMGLLMGLLFLGSVGLTQSLAVVAGPEETILSALARRLTGGGVAFLLIQFSTMLILAVAANTSFAGFPRLAALLSRDGYLPHQLAGLGDRLVFANAILLLAAATAVLIIVFGGDTHALIPLFAVGVFLAFTLSQFGMVIHWWRVRGQGWRLKAAVNGVGALATGVALAVIGASRFLDGAWITILLIPIMVVAFLKIRAHYQDVARQLSMQSINRVAPVGIAPRVVIPISGVHRGIVDAVAYARSISQDVTAVYVELEPGAGQPLREKWERWWPDVPLAVLPSPYRSLVGPLLVFLDKSDEEHNDGQLATVVLPEFVPARWWHSFLHNQSAWLIKAALLYRRRHLGYQRVIVDIPYHLDR
jgi:amino acid transporter